jgi:hypothetical protein
VLDVLQDPGTVVACAVRVVSSDDWPFKVACPYSSIVIALLVAQESVKQVPPLSENVTTSETLTPRTVGDAAKLYVVPSLRVITGWSRMEVTQE